MERLTEMYGECMQLKACRNELCLETCEKHDTCSKCPINEAIEKFSEYEDLDEQGLLLKLPCKIGDTVYVILHKDRIVKMECLGFYVGRTLRSVNLFPMAKRAGLYQTGFDEFGKTIFFTREEAEKALVCNDSRRWII